MKNKPTDNRFRQKHCPYCMTAIEISLRQCSWCHRKVGEINKFGIAKEPVKWGSYLWLAVAIAGLIVFWSYVPF